MSVRYKYPRTPHLPWSPGATSDDVALSDVSVFHGLEVVVTEKMDGENTTLYRDHVHARSVDSSHHPSRSWVKALQSAIGSMIPEGYRLCGENLYAEHSIRYEGLPSYFLLFAAFDAQNVALSWDDTTRLADELGLSTVPVLYRGPWDERRLRTITASIDTRAQEGIVVRRADAYAFPDFGRSVAKWVRAGHVTTDGHWLSRPVTPNRMRGAR